MAVAVAVAVAVQAGKVEAGSEAHAFSQSIRTPRRRYQNHVPRPTSQASGGRRAEKSKPPLIRRTESRPGKTFGIASHAFENP